jgi:hypothetical protein
LAEGESPDGWLSGVMTSCERIGGSSGGQCATIDAAVPGWIHKNLRGGKHPMAPSQLLTHSLNYQGQLTPFVIACRRLKKLLATAASSGYFCDVRWLWISICSLKSGEPITSQS